MLKETMGVFDTVRTHAWYGYSGYEFGALTTCTDARNRI